MISRDRPALQDKAVEAFRRQTYHNKQLLILDNSETPRTALQAPPSERTIQIPSRDSVTIGELRNYANAVAVFHMRPVPTILVHWDDDDWSHSKRIEEQVVSLLLSRADAVGYASVLFWREVERETWLYSNPVMPPGSSLCYWARTWQEKPFPAVSDGEDTQWCMGLNVKVDHPGAIEQPRLVARIHEGNARRLVYNRDVMAALERQDGTWRRVPECDAYCERVLR